VGIVLLDTDVLINLLRGREKARLFIEKAASDGVVGCSVITVAEIYAGMKAHEKERTDALLDGLEIIEVTRSIAEKAGIYKANTKGHALELDDCIIAATAFYMKATLATGNGKHYPMKDIVKEVVKFSDEFPINRQNPSTGKKK
jgi:predicted nucleic acid-binding protein